MTTLDLARRFIGIQEKQNGENTPVVLAMLQLCDASVHDTEVPWCSGFCNFIAWLLGLPRSKSLSARSWLSVGSPVPLAVAQPGDVVILMRGSGPQPDATVLQAPGHVGFLDHYDGKFVFLLAGNQTNAINVAAWPAAKVLGVRRLA